MPNTLLRRENAPRFEVPGTVVTGYASPGRGCKTISAWKVELEPGAGSPVHELTHDEAFIVLRGRATVRLGGEEFSVAHGDGFSVPPATAFAIRNDHDEVFEAIACMASGGKARVGGEPPFSPPWTV